MNTSKTSLQNGSSLLAIPTSISSKSILPVAQAKNPGVTFNYSLSLIDSKSHINVIVSGTCLGLNSSSSHLVAVLSWEIAKLLLVSALSPIKWGLIVSCIL